MIPPGIQTVDLLMPWAPPGKGAVPADGAFLLSLAVLRTARQVKRGDTVILRSKPRILLVEDQAAVARDIQRLMVELGCVIVGISLTCNDAVEKVAQLKPDLVMMDVRMTGETEGRERTDRICRIFSIPVLFVSAVTGIEPLEPVPAECEDVLPRLSSKPIQRWMHPDC